MWERITEYRWIVTGFLLALLGGMVRGVGCSREVFTWWGFCQRILSAAFVGILATLILAHSDMHEGLKTAVAGAAGYAANDVLSALKPWVKRRLGLDK